MEELIYYNITGAESVKITYPKYTASTHDYLKEKCNWGDKDMIIHNDGRYMFGDNGVKRRHQGLLHNDEYKRLQEISYDK
jgi:hypothetical protein